MLSGVFFAAAAEEPIALDSIDPPNFYITYDDHINILMAASSLFDIDSIYIDDNKAILRDGIFTVSGLPLILGRNAFIIRLNDTLGNTSNYLYTVYRQEPAKEPEASIETPEEPVSSEEVITQAAIDETVKAEPVTTAKEIPVNTQSSPVAGGFLTKTSPITTYKNVILADSASDTFVSSPVLLSSVSTSGSQSYVSEESVSSNGALTVVFSSPYDKQVVTENSLKISGSFDPSAGISSITVNGQACSPDFTNNTFTGPMLISPGEARRKGVKSDSSEYIIMDVDSNTHSGKNILKVLITNDLGRTDKQDLIFYYYQLFVKANTYGESIFTYDDGTIISLPVRNIQSYNKGLLCNPPYSGWVYPEKAYRDENHNSWPFIFAYSDDMKAFYFTENYPASLFTSWGNAVPGTTGHSSVDTHLLLHAPPAGDTPFILVLKHVATIESLPIYSGWVYSAIANYKFNGCDILPLAAPSCLGRYDSCYVVIDEFTPDEDFYVNVQTPNYGEGFRTAFARVDRFFSIGNITTLTADILVDSNNDGLLGGEDNAYEMVSPGCVFWVNDDDDYNESSIHQDDSNPALASGEADCHDNKINGIRDLEDFMPLNITIPDIKEWTNNQNVKFYLKAEGEGKIRVFMRTKDMREYGAKTYLNDLNSSKSQYQEEMKFLLPSDDNKIEGQLLDPSWFDSDGNFYAIFEGVSEGSLKLTLEVELGEGGSKKRFTLDEAVIALKDIRKMYKVENIREGPTNTDGLIRYRNKTELGEIFASDPSRVIIWVHGYNNTLEGSLGSADIVYKRLYQTGFRGSFVFISWDTADWVQPFSAFNFNGDWVSSFRSAHITADIINDARAAYPDARIDVVAHSLGNNLVLYSLRLLSAEDKTPIDNFIMAEPAVQGEVFSGLSRMPYYDLIGVRHDFFDNMYANSLNAVSGKIYNTYSTNDGALKLAFKVNNLILALPTPMDDRYNLVNDTTLTIGNEYTNPLGLAKASSPYGKFVSRSFYPPDYNNKADKNTRPYGIRDHCSMTVEYYYDVQRFYNYILTQKDDDNREAEE
ncbi:MAG: alpha/beta hydrolase [Candidatus Omnitrophota bacterium]